MRITLKTNNNAIMFMRRAGYGFQKESGNEIGFIRRIGSPDFPRYHAYVKEVRSGKLEVGGGKLGVGSGDGENRGAYELQVNLHVDQKRPTYEGSHAHGGEYDGSLVEQEAARLRQLAQTQHIEEPKSPRIEESEEKKGFWEKLFGR
ncbi:MAG: hypothetical protein V1723_04525 [Candidatus Uhrbacteria bacterium]